MRPKRRKTQAARTLDDEVEDLTPGNAIMACNMNLHTIMNSRAEYRVPHGLEASNIELQSTIGQKQLSHFLPS